jgi:hypothetical protein
MCVMCHVQLFLLQLKSYVHSTSDLRCSAKWSWRLVCPHATQINELKHENVFTQDEEARCSKLVIYRYKYLIFLQRFHYFSVIMMIILETGVDDNLHETIHTKSILANYNTSICLGGIACTCQVLAVNLLSGVRIRENCKTHDRFQMLGQVHPVTCWTLYTSI